MGELKASTRRSTYLAGESVKVSISIANLLQTARYFQTPNAQATRHPSNQTEKHEGPVISDDASSKQSEKTVKPEKPPVKGVINTSTTNCLSSVDSGEVIRPERVAWVSVYLHCECVVNRNKVAVDNITAALAPVKSVLQGQNPHDFDTGSSAHLFHEGTGDGDERTGGFAQNEQSGRTSQGAQGKGQRDSDNSGVGGLVAKGFAPKTSLA